MMKKIGSIILVVALCLSLVPNIPVKAASYEVKVYQSQVTTVIGHAVSGVFYFYKDGKRICTPKGAKYKSSDSSVVKVEKSGGCVYLRGKKVGKATVTCTYKGVSAKILVRIKKIAVSANGWKCIYLPVGSSIYVNVDSYQFKNIGNLTVENSDSKLIKVSKSKITPFIWNNSANYTGPNISAKREGTATVTFKSKVGTETIKVNVVPRIKVKISNVEKQAVEGGFNFSYDITNYSSVTIRVGGPTLVGVHRGLHEAMANEKEVNLAKGKKATYTFFVPLRDSEDFVCDTITNIVLQYKGNSFMGYVEEDGSFVTSQYLGRVPMNATISEYYLQ